MNQTTSDFTTIIDRETLKSKFKDNEIPTGDDFADLIDSAVNQQDDGIKVVGDEIHISNSLVFKNVQDAEHDDNSPVIQAGGFNFPGKLFLGGVSDNKFTAYDILEVNPENGVKILTPSDADGNFYPLHVSGKSKLAGDVEISGAARLTSSLNVTGDSIFSGKLSVGINGDSIDALVHVVKRSDGTTNLLRLDDQLNDHTAFVVNAEGMVGVGVLHPQNRLEVSGSVLIGDNSERVMPDNSLSVQGKIGVGTLAPKNSLDVIGSAYIGSGSMDVLPNNTLAVEGKIGVGTTNPIALLDVHSQSENDLFKLRKDDKTFVKVTANPSETEKAINLNDDTKVGGSLTVDNKITSNEAKINGTLDAEASTFTSVNVSGLTQTQTLLVSSSDAGLTETDKTAGALINTTLTVKDSAQFTTINTSANITSAEKLTGQNGQINSRLRVGVPDNNSDATADAILHVQGAGDDQSALLIKDNDQHDLFRAKNGKIGVGYEGGSTQLEVHGQTSADSLLISGHSKLASGRVNDSFVIASDTKPDDWMVDSKFRVCADGNTANAVNITYQNGSQEYSLIHTKADKVGICQANPQASFHVGKDSIFDANVCFKTGFQVFGYGASVADGEASSAFSVDLSGTTIGSASALASNMDFVSLNAYANTKIYGTFNVGSVLQVADKQLLLRQQPGESGQVQKPIPFKIEQDNASLFIEADAGRLAINTPLTPDSVNLSVTGSAEITGSLQITASDENLALDILGKAQITDTLSVTGKGSFDNGLDISITTNSAEENQTPALNVSGLTKLNGELNTAGHAILNKSLTVNENGIFKDQLTVNGATSLLDTVHIQGNDTDAALTVEKQADFRDNILVAGNIGLSTEDTSARLHIYQVNQQQAAFKIDKPGTDVAELIFTQGKLGIGINNPENALEVKGNTKLHRDLYVSGRISIQDSLHVDEYATFHSNVNVHGTTELHGETVIGDAWHKEDKNEKHIHKPSTQLRINQNHFEQAFAVYSEKNMPVVIKDGKLGIGIDDPKADLDVLGNTHLQGLVKIGELASPERLECYSTSVFIGDMTLHSDLTVGDDTQLNGSLDVQGQTHLHADTNITGALNVSQNLNLAGSAIVNNLVEMRDRLTVAKDTSLKSNLDVEGNSWLRGNLNVTNPNSDAKVTIDPETLIRNKFAVEKNSEFMGDCQFDSTLSIGTNNKTKDALVNLRAKVDQSPLVIDVDVDVNEGINTDTENSTNSKRVFIVNAAGNVGIGCSQPQATLDIRGDANIETSICAAQGIIKESLQIGTSVQIGNGAEIQSVSPDIELGGINSADTVLATQAAIKAYIDKQAWGFGGGGKTYIVSCQSEFNKVFNKGVLQENTTVLLFPAVNSTNGSNSSQSNTHEHYKLNNEVELKSGVTIIGFNESTTIITKHKANCRFIIKDSENITLSGFTFDGNNLEFSGSGGAFRLRNAKHCQLNCVIRNHKVEGHGGALFAEDHRGQPTSDIESNNIQSCSAGDAGGAAYGLCYSKIKATKCSANYGGAIAYCDDMQAEVTHCYAEESGGGAYCCKSLICDGMWRGNTAAKADNIFTNDHHHDQNESNNMPDNDHYYWHAIYIDNPIHNNSNFWNSKNI